MFSYQLNIVSAGAYRSIAQFENRCAHFLQGK